MIIKEQIWVQKLSTEIRTPSHLIPAPINSELTAGVIKGGDGRVCLRNCLIDFFPLSIYLQVQWVKKIQRNSLSCHKNVTWLSCSVLADGCSTSPHHKKGKNFICIVFNYFPGISSALSHWGRRNRGWLGLYKFFQGQIFPKSDSKGSDSSLH